MDVTGKPQESVNAQLTHFPVHAKFTNTTQTQSVLTKISKQRT